MKTKDGEIRLNNAQELELIKLAQSGNEAAEETLIRRYIPLVKARAGLYYIVGADDDDTVQEGMIGLAKAIAAYDAGKNAEFKTFAELCINRQILSAIKAAKRKKNSPLNESVSMESPADEEKTKTIADTIDAIDCNNPESLVVIWDIIERFDEIEQSVLSRFELSVWNAHKTGNGISEIAEALGKNEKSVRNALNRAKNKLADAVKNG